MLRRTESPPQRLTCFSCFFSATSRTAASAGSPEIAPSPFSANFGAFSRARFSLLAGILLVTFSVSVCAQEPEPKQLSEKVLTAQNQSKVLAAESNPDSEPAKSANEDPNYSIGASDVLTIDVWKEPEISRSVPVRNDGKISLPLLNDVQAAGLTPTELSSEIAERLGKILVNPQVTVIVTQMNSQRFYILGQVAHTGVFPLEPNMTAVQALSTAGGFTAFANLKKIYVLRSEGGQKEILPVNYKEALSGRKPNKEVLLKTGDTIVVP